LHPYGSPYFPIMSILKNKSFYDIETADSQVFLISPEKSPIIQQSNSPEENVIFATPEYS